MYLYMCIYLYAVENVTAIKSSFLLDSFIVDKCLENEHCREHDTTLCDIIILLYILLLLLLLREANNKKEKSDAPSGEIVIIFDFSDTEPNARSRQYAILLSLLLRCVT